MAQSATSERHDKESEVQRRSFTKWINKQLRKGDYEEQVVDLSEDLKTGIIMMKVLAATCGMEIPPHNKKCKEVHRVSNQGVVLDMFEKAKIRLVGIGPQDLSDGRLKAVLGMVWSLIYAQQIGSIQGEVSGKQGLLLWVKRATAGYDGVEVRDFTKSWASGLALTALIHKHKPNSISFDDAKDLTPLERIETCINVAHSELGIDPLIEAPDMEEAIDDKATMTYISEFFAAFSKVMDSEVAKRRVTKFFETQKTIDQLSAEYEKKSGNVVRFVDNQVPNLEEEIQVKGLLKCKDLLDEANEFRTGPLARKRIMKEGLESTLASLQATLSLAHRPAYTPKHALDEVEEKWKTLEDAAENYIRECRQRYVQAKERQSKKYKELTDGLNERIQEIYSELGELKGENPKKLLKLVAVYKEAAEELEDDLAQGLRLNDQLEAAQINVDDIVGLKHTIDDLERSHSELVKAITRHEELLVRQIEASKSGTVSEQKMKEIQETFKLFDSNKSESLSLDDFANAVKGLGRNLSDKETAALFKSACKSAGDEMQFDEFVEVMANFEKDADTPDEILQSIASLQKGNGLSLNDLIEALGEDTAAYFAEKIPEKDGKYDFKAYLEQVYGTKK
ncbi:Alpha-actinin-like protein 1 [Diplonema papillatum]|nr:Alpha-actinin-like protein 1 [Diplonema papillatum]KAJ9468238.1 Alpha-actinin-like protein 1 [Diplonema papillatum]